MAETRIPPAEPGAALLRAGRSFRPGATDAAVEIVAAAHVHTVGTYGPDRIAGFSPIPALSMVSHAAGARFHSLIGAPESALPEACSLGYEGGPGAGGDGPFGQDSGRRRLPPQQLTET